LTDTATNNTAAEVRSDAGGRLLLKKKGLAELLDMSPRTIDRKDASGQIPRPIKLAGSKRWRRTEILAWIEAGCPPRKQWEAMPTNRHLPARR
jgi:predicted DNA-binding transcriptional regulator AlpA